MDLFEGTDTVTLFVEIPISVYNGINESYENGINSGTHDLPLEQYVGGLVCEGVNSLYIKQQMNTKEFARHFLEEDIPKEYIMTMFNSQMLIATQQLNRAKAQENDIEAAKFHGMLQVIQSMYDQVLTYGRL